MTDLDQAREAIAEIDRTIAKLDHETRGRIARMTDLDGDADWVSREEWRKFYDQTRPLRKERSSIVQAMVDVLSIETLPPIIVTDT